MSLATRGRGVCVVNTRVHACGAMLCSCSGQHVCIHRGQRPSCVAQDRSSRLPQVAVYMDKTVYLLLTIDCLPASAVQASSTNLTTEVRKNGEDHGEYTVSSAYELFFQAREDSPFGEILWKSKTPSRVKFFMWLALQGKCLTADNLSRRNWQHNDQCQLCRHKPETCLHLFVDCEFTDAIWCLARQQLQLGSKFQTPKRISSRPSRLVAASKGKFSSELQG